MKYLSLLLICFCLNACLKSEGTDTGNPSADRDLNEVIDPRSAITKMASRLCDLIDECEGTNTNCIERIYNQQNIDTKLGLVDGEFGTLADIHIATLSGVLIENENIANACYDDLDALECSSPKVSDAYDNSKHNPFEGVADIVPASCNGIVTDTD